MFVLVSIFIILCGATLFFDIMNKRVVIQFKSRRETIASCRVLIIFLLLLVFVASTRTEKYTDYINYVGLFNYSSSLSGLYDSAIKLDVNALMFPVEPGWQLIMALIKPFFSYKMLMVIVPVSSFFLYYKVFSIYSSMPLLTLLIYYSSMYVPKDLIQIRHSLSIAIVFFAIQYLNRSFIKYVLLVIVASLIHITSLSFIILYPLCKIRFRPIWFVYSSLLASIMCLLNVSVVSLIMTIPFVSNVDYFAMKGAYYAGLDPVGVLRGNVFNIALAVVLVITIPLFLRKEWRKNAIYYKYYLTMFFSLIIICLSPDYFDVQLRFLNSCYIAYAIIAPTVIRACTNLYKKIIMISFTIILIGFYCSYSARLIAN